VEVNTARYVEQCHSSVPLGVAVFIRYHKMQDTTLDNQLCAMHNNSISSPVDLVFLPSRVCAFLWLEAFCNSDRVIFRILSFLICLSSIGFPQGS
jgi:hypothetical protein